ncbi:hypothetical protein DOY81_006365 [Sarcophaga bullata]|nr:hypothetical protein DOY81_006365 [Sarcophaga bullata]
MGNVKNVFKILLIVQLIACSLAHYGHPDAETIDFGSPTQPSRDQAIIEAAIKRGMDGDAVAELLRTKKPVVRIVNTPGGVTKTTTYSLEDDGTISRKIVTQTHNRYVYNSGNVPDSIPIDELQKSPTGTITRTFTDADGNKVTQRIAIDKPKATSILGQPEITGDWINKPFSSWPSQPSAYSPPSSNPWLSGNPKPHTYSHRTVTRTYTGPNGEKHVVQSTSNSPTPTLEQPPRHKFPAIGDIDWPTLDEPTWPHDWNTPDTDDADDWVVVNENPNVEATTKKTFASWTPKTWDWPEFTTPTTTSTSTTTTRTTTKARTPKPLPSLDDFLKSQYGPSTTTSRTATFTSTSKAMPTFNTPSSTTLKPKVINIEDLPVTEVLYNGQPANDSVIKSLPPHLKPTMPTEPVLKIEHKQPVEENIELFTPKVETNIRTYSKTLTSPEKPTLQDLDPQMQEALRKAGISPDDITNIEGDTITKTRTEPDGRIITTTYKINSTPIVHEMPTQQHHSYTPPKFTSHSFNSYRPLTLPHAPLQPLTPFGSGLSPIAEFLAKLGLTKYDIISRNNHYSKTFIDDNGDVLTATFVLSSPRAVGAREQPKPKPYK